MADTSTTATLTNADKQSFLNRLRFLHGAFDRLNSSGPWRALIPVERDAVRRFCLFRVGQPHGASEVVHDLADTSAVMELGTLSDQAGELVAELAGYGVWHQGTVGESRYKLDDGWELWTAWLIHSKGTHFGCRAEPYGSPPSAGPSLSFAVDVLDKSPVGVVNVCIDNYAATCRAGIAWLIGWVEKLSTESEKDGERPLPDQSEQMSAIARAIAFMSDRHKATGKVPKGEEIANAAGVHRGTLYRDPTFRSALKAIRSASPPPKGYKDAAGNIEAVGEEEDD
jgi:hypothetical protein